MSDPVKRRPLGGRERAAALTDRAPHCRRAPPSRVENSPREAVTEAAGARRLAWQGTAPRIGRAIRPARVHPHRQMTRQRAPPPPRGRAVPSRRGRGTAGATLRSPPITTAVNSRASRNAAGRCWGPARPSCPRASGASSPRWGRRGVARPWGGVRSAGRRRRVTRDPQDTWQPGVRRGWLGGGGKHRRRRRRGGGRETGHWWRRRRRAAAARGRHARRHARAAAASPTALHQPRRANGEAARGERSPAGRRGVGCRPGGTAASPFG